MSAVTAARLAELSVGYGLDGGGYAFANPGAPMAAALAPRVGCVVWDGCDFDYFPGWYEGLKDVHGGLAVFDHGAYPSDVPWPPVLPCGDDVEWRFVSAGYLNDSDRECDCQGKHGYTGWEYTGDYTDPPNPECPRCDGDGHVTSDGGRWAVYDLQETAPTYGPVPTTLLALEIAISELGFDGLSEALTERRDTDPTALFSLGLFMLDCHADLNKDRRVADDLPHVADAIWARAGVLLRAWYNHVGAV